MHLANAADNTIGGTIEAARNVIAGNLANGIYLGGADATGNVVQHNHVGVDTTGATKVANAGNGVYVDGAPENQVRNCLISGNGLNGVLIDGPAASENLIEDNVIGVSIWLDQVLGNGRDGVRLDGAPDNTVKGNTIGGNGRSTIPYTDAGVQIAGAGATDNLVQGNSIGVDPSGTVKLGNAGSGVRIEGAPGNTVGGPAAADGNLISANLDSGVYVYGTGALSNTLQRNQTGTDASGTAAQGNGISGVYILGARGTIVAANLISGNQGNGIWIQGDTTANTEVRDNYIGTNLTGDARLPNHHSGVAIASASRTTLAGNLISGNGHGVVVSEEAISTTLRGNRIGTDASGTARLGNEWSGVVVQSSAQHTLIGTRQQTAPGATCTDDCNLISGNGQGGIAAWGENTIIRGNYIGTTLAGNAELGNTEYGVSLDRGQVRANVIAGNKRGGISTSSGGWIWIDANYIGVAANGVTELPNGDTGVHLQGGPVTVVHGNRIWHNEYNRAFGSRIVHNSFYKAKVGIRCDSATLSGNDILANVTGIGMVGAFGPCKASDNNILMNTDYGARVTYGRLEAPFNWWGAADGPGGDGPGSGDRVAGNVLYEPWRGSPVAVHVTAGGAIYGPPGGLAAQAGQPASGWVYVQNWAHPTDTITVTLVDSLGWLASPASLTVPITGGLGGAALVSFTIPAGAPIGMASTVTVTAVSGADPADSDGDTFPVIAARPVDLALRMTSDVATAAVGRPLHYTLRITNTGPYAASSVVVTDILPAEVRLDAVVPSQGACAAMTGTVVCELGALAVDAQATIDLQVTVTATGEYDEVVNGAWAMVTGAHEYDPDLDDNGDTASVPVRFTVFLPLAFKDWRPPPCADGLEAVGHVGGPLYGLAVQGPYAYAAEGATLAVLDVSDPAKPWRVGYAQLPYKSNDVAVAGDYAYVTTNADSGLRVISVADKANPVEVGAYEMYGYALGVALLGDHLYVIQAAPGSRSIVVFSLADPAQPTFVGGASVSLYAWNLHAVGDHVYVAGGPDGLQVLDVSDPANPTLVGAYAATRANGVYVADGHAYVAAGAAGLQVLAVADPANPTPVGSYPSAGAYDVVVAASDPPGHTYAYLADEDGLLILAVDDPANPTLVGSTGAAGAISVVRVAAGSLPGHTYAYAVGGAPLQGGRLYVLAVSDPAQPAVAGIRWAFTDMEGIAAAAGLAGVADRDLGLGVVSLADPRAPTLVGVYASPGLAVDVHVVDDAAAGHPYAYLVDNVMIPPFQVDGYVRIISLADPAHPVQVGFYQTSGWLESVYVQGDYAYVLRYDSLRVLSVADKAHPVEVGALAGLSSPQQVDMRGDYLYLAGGPAGLVVVSVADPHNPVQVSQYSTVGTAWGVQVGGDIAYVAANFGLELVDVSNPLAPVGRAYLATPGQAVAVRVAGDYAYVADGWAGLRLVCVADPDNPTEVDFYDVGGASDVYAAAGYSYIADRSNGLIVLRLVPRALLRVP